MSEVTTVSPTAEGRAWAIEAERLRLALEHARDLLGKAIAAFDEAEAAETEALVDLARAWRAFSDSFDTPAEVALKLTGWRRVADAATDRKEAAEEWMTACLDAQRAATAAHDRFVFR